MERLADRDHRPRRPAHRQAAAAAGRRDQHARCGLTGRPATTPAPLARRGHARCWPSSRPATPTTRSASATCSRAWASAPSACCRSWPRSPPSSRPRAGGRATAPRRRSPPGCSGSRSPRPARTMRTDRPAGDDASPPRPPGTRALLALLAAGDPDETSRFCDVFAGLGERAFGMLLFVATLPAFIPIPGVGGAISGPLAILIGLQLLAGRRIPWLPKFIARRGPHRHAMARFERMLSPWLGRLERLVKPRLSLLLDHRVAGMLSGLLRVLLGLLLALPIPFTNYIFGSLLLLFALALLERDGALMIAAWIAGAIAIAVFGILSGTLAAAATEWLDRLF